MIFCACCNEPIEDPRRRKYCSNWCSVKRVMADPTEELELVDVQLRNDEAYGLQAPAIRRVAIEGGADG